MESTNLKWDTWFQKKYKLYYKNNIKTQKSFDYYPTHYHQGNSENFDQLEPNNQKLDGNKLHSQA